jgi:hypothetical protein
MTEKKFKSYEEMTQEERSEPNREDLTRKNGDLVFYPPIASKDKVRSLSLCHWAVARRGARSCS